MPTVSVYLVATPVIAAGCKTLTARLRVAPEPETQPLNVKRREGHNVGDDCEASAPARRGQEPLEILAHRDELTLLSLSPNG